MERDSSLRIMQYRSFVDVCFAATSRLLLPKKRNCLILRLFQLIYVIQAQAEHKYYLDSCTQSVSELVSGGTKQGYAPYMFDLAEQLTLPHHSCQVGPMYFKVGRKVQLLGICCDSTKVQHNYLIDESEIIGENGPNHTVLNPSLQCWTTTSVTTV